MNVSMDLGRLRALGAGGPQWRSYALRFALGGLFTVLTGLIAKGWGPVLGGLLLAFPVILPAATTLIAKQHRDRKALQGLAGAVRGRRAAALDAFGAVYGAIGMMAFAFFVWRELPRGAAPLAVLAEGAALWLLMSLVVWSLRKVRRGRRLRPL